MNWSPAKKMSKAKRDCINVANGTSCQFYWYSAKCLDQFAIFRYRTSVYCAGQTIIMNMLFRVMASAHVSEQFWNDKRSHCPVGPFWNGNFCRSVLERFGREPSGSHCA